MDDGLRPRSTSGMRSEMATVVRCVFARTTSGMIEASIPLHPTTRHAGSTTLARSPDGPAWLNAWSTETAMRPGPLSCGQHAYLADQRAERFLATTLARADDGR